jgi:uncharacterized protein (DUF4415 family)
LPRDFNEEVQCPRKKTVSKHGWIDPDDASEWTQEQFERAEIAIGGKVVRSARGTLTRPRGRPKKPDAKVHTHIRLSPQVLEYFRATGPGWPASTKYYAHGSRGAAGRVARAGGTNRRLDRSADQAASGTTVL